MDTQDVPHWLTTREVAERWQMSARTLERWRVKGTGPGWVMLGRRVRYTSEAIVAYEITQRRGYANEPERSG